MLNNYKILLKRFYTFQLVYILDVDDLFKILPHEYTINYTNKS
jgi:hypothetical protein